MKTVPIEQALGHRLAYDVTEVTPTTVQSIITKGTLIEKRHLSLLRNAGHTLIYIEEDGLLEDGQDLIQEGPASFAIAQALAGSQVTIKKADSGKTLLLAKTEGLVKIQTDTCHWVNHTDVALVISKPSLSVVRTQELVAVVDLIPLTVSTVSLSNIIKHIGNPGFAIDIRPFLPLTVGLLITGTEVYEGRIPDAVAPIVQKQVQMYGGTQGTVQIVPDDEDLIVSALHSMVEEHDVVIVTGGMSVDPTDRTPFAIRRVADTVLKYGIPLLPNAMSMVAQKGETVILGISSGLVYYQQENILDKLLPLVFAQEPITREYLVSLGIGGLMPSFTKNFTKIHTP
ncbi:hypothetical protein D2Q93_11115 [Alicyclobacillaceae bacterium I2511]|nr:hypothetical protein D2Q93_11115 [Alicyclobacillaceae bacterium I2511]